MAYGVEYKGNKIIKNVDSIDFMDPKRMVAIHGAKLLAGQGLTLKGNEDRKDVNEFFKHFIKFNRLDDFILEVSEVANYYGGVLITINKTETGDFMLDYADPDKLINGIVIGINEIAAEFYKTITSGTAIYIYKEIWTKTEIIRQGMTGMGPGDVALPFTEWSAEIPKELQVKERETHGLGFVPFVLIKNRPGRKTPANNLRVLSDDNPVKDLPLQINHLWRQLYKDVIFSKARAFGSFTKAYYQKLKKEGRELATYAADFLTDVETRGAGAGRPIELQAANPAILIYLDGIAKVYDEYIKGCGYSTAETATGDASVVETLFSKSGDVETTKIKRERWQEALSALFDKLLVWKGLMLDLNDERPYTFEIKENVIYGETQLTTMIAEQVNNNFLTQAEAIAKLRGIDLEEAEEIAEDINKKSDEEMKKLQENAIAMQQAQQKPGTETPNTQEPQENEVLETNKGDDDEAE